MISSSCKPPRSFFEIEAGATELTLPRNGYPAPNQNPPELGSAAFAGSRRDATLVSAIWTESVERRHPRCSKQRRDNTQ